MNKKDIENLTEAYEQMQSVKDTESVSQQNPVEITSRSVGAGHANFMATVYWPFANPASEQTMERYLSGVYNDLPELFERDPRPTPAGGSNILFLRYERDFRVDVNSFDEISPKVYEVDFDIAFTREGKDTTKGHRYDFEGRRLESTEPQKPQVINEAFDSAPWGAQRKSMDKMADAHYNKMGPTIRATKLSPSAMDGPKWLKIINDEMGIAPRDVNAEESVYSFFDDPISKHFRVRKVRGARKNGIKIMFDGGETGLAFNVTPQSTVSQVLAATYHSYQETFEKIAEIAIGSSADEYKGM